MKRGSTLLIILCIALIIPGIILGARDRPFHLFWNMPFGLKMENCLARLHNESPYEFVEVPNEEDENTTALLSSRRSDIYHMDYPVDVALIFTSGLYNEACIVFRHDEAYIDAIQSPDGVLAESSEAHLQKTLSTYFDLLKKINAQYRNTVMQPVIATDQVNEKTIPIWGTEAEMAEIAELMQSVKTASLSVGYDNISLSIDKSIMGEDQMPVYTIYMTYEGDA